MAALSPPVAGGAVAGAQAAAAMPAPVSADHLKKSRRVSGKYDLSFTVIAPLFQGEFMQSQVRAWWLRQQFT
jgi:hypothetical protein